MATNTTKLGLIKPDLTDIVDVGDLNNNADDIDAAVGFTICTSATRPASPWAGQTIFETDTTSSFVWDGSAWQAAGGGGGSITVSATAPVSPPPGNGDLWWDSDNGNMYIYYEDVDSSQWVAANGPQVFVGAAAPAGYQGQMWFDSSTGKMYVFYDDGTSSQWVSAIGGSLAGSVLQVVSTTKTTVFSTTSSSMVDVTGFSATITPSSTSSKILVIASFVAGNNSSTGSIQFNLLRNSTDIGKSTGSATQNSTLEIFTNSTGSGDSNSLTFLDSPSTTSSTTYKIQMRLPYGGTGYVGRIAAGDQGSSSTITLIEVAG